MLRLYPYISSTSTCSRRFVSRLTSRISLVTTPATPAKRHASHLEPRLHSLTLLRCSVPFLVRHTMRPIRRLCTPTGKLHIHHDALLCRGLIIHLLETLRPIHPTNIHLRKSRTATPFPRPPRAGIVPLSLLQPPMIQLGTARRSPAATDVPRRQTDLRPRSSPDQATYHTFRPSTAGSRLFIYALSNRFSDS